MKRIVRIELQVLREIRSVSEQVHFWKGISNIMSSLLGYPMSLRSVACLKTILKRSTSKVSECIILERALTISVSVFTAFEENISAGLRMESWEEVFDVTLDLLVQFAAMSSELLTETLGCDLPVHYWSRRAPELWGKGKQTACTVGEVHLGAKT